MWHQKKQVVVRLHQLGLNAEQIDQALFPGESPQAARILRDVDTASLPRDTTFGGWNKARYIVSAYRMFDRAMRELDVRAHPPQSKQKTPSGTHYKYRKDQ